MKKIEKNEKIQFLGVACWMYYTYVLVLFDCDVTVISGGNLVATAFAFGLIIGLTLVLVHLLGINLPYTSVNPERSIASTILQ